MKNIIYTRLSTYASYGKMQTISHYVGDNAVVPPCMKYGN